MRSYGMSRRNADDDVRGLASNGRKSSLGNLSHNSDGDVRAYKALRGGGRAKTRRVQKRRARRANRICCDAG